MRTLHVSFFPDKVCDEHGIWDVFACPWPGCPNGYEEDTFQTQDAYITKPSIYSRKEWRSPVGGNYYTWASDDLPHWFSVPKTFWNEARRLRLSVIDPPSTIYHYTNVEGFVGIVRSRSLWLSDYSYLNDKRELIHGIETIGESIREMLQKGPNDRVAKLLQAWDGEISKPAHRVYIASFAADGDDLSQWRAYGPIAVGIEPQDLSIHANQTNLQPVEYNRDTQRKLADIYLNHMTQAYEVDLSAGMLEKIPDVYHRIDRLVELAAFFKDPAFQTEREYRLAYIEYPEMLRALRLTPPLKRFRLSKSKLFPYVVSDELFPRKDLCRPLDIHEVVLGPESDELLERGVREFLASSEMRHVKVRRSTVPYRA